MKDLGMMKDGKDLKENVNSLSCLVLGGTEVNPQKWTEKIPPELYEVKKRSKYEEKEVFDLVRLIRNKVRFIKHFFMDTGHHGAAMGPFRDVHKLRYA